MSVVLIGFMGAGKTTSLQNLAGRYQLQTCDLDQHIIKQEKRDINTIFAQAGEAYFRRLEYLNLQAAIAHDFDCIAAGGGIVEASASRQLLQQVHVIWLAPSFELCWQRIKNDASRPLVNQQSKSELQTLFSRREVYYDQLADAKVDIYPNQTATEIADRLYQELN